MEIEYCYNDFRDNVAVNIRSTYFDRIRSKVGVNGINKFPIHVWVFLFLLTDHHCRVIAVPDATIPIVVLGI